MFSTRYVYLIDDHLVNSLGYRSYFEIEFNYERFVNWDVLILYRHVFDNLNCCSIDVNLDNRCGNSQQNSPWQNLLLIHVWDLDKNAEIFDMFPLKRIVLNTKPFVYNW